MSVDMEIPNYQFGFDLPRWVEKPRPIDPTSLVEQVLGGLLMVVTGALIFHGRKKG